MVCNLTTNGYFLPQYAKDLSKMGLNQVIVSIDGPPEIHNHIRGVDSAFERAIEGIQIFSRHNSKTKIGINYTISNYNYDQLYETIKMLDDLVGWDFFIFIHLSFVDEHMANNHNFRFRDYKATSADISGIDMSSLDFDILKEQIQKVQAKFVHRNFRFHPEVAYDDLETYYLTPATFLHPKRCLVPWYYTNILSNGDIVPMNRCGTKPFGNLLQQDFKTVWNGLAYRNFRQMLRKEGAFPICSRCGGIFVH
jgi:MoaA/NifB/PqqE/SkfB family radical SAM enzyme